MILYFSGVGNTRLVAERLASLCNDRAVALTPTTPPLSDLCHKDEPLILLCHFLYFFRKSCNISFMETFVCDKTSKSFF